MPQECACDCGKVLIRIGETLRQMQARMDALVAQVEDGFSEVKKKRREAQLAHLFGSHVC